MENDRFHIQVVEHLKCADIERLLDPYLDGELGAGMVEAFELHLQTCSSCKSLVFDCREIIHLARELGSQPIPAGVSDRLRQALNEEIGAAVFKHRPVLTIVKSN